MKADNTTEAVMSMPRMTDSVAPALVAQITDMNIFVGILASRLLHIKMKEHEPSADKIAADQNT